MIQSLLENGAYIHARNDMMLSPVLCAARNGHLEAVKLLLKLGACPEDCDVCGGGLLDAACRPFARNLDLLAWLTAQFPWRSYVSWPYEGTLLHHALEGHGDSERAIFLVENGANLFHVSRVMGYPIHVSAYFGHTSFTQGLLPLIPADRIKEVLDYASTWIGTALYAASSQGHTEIVEMLLNAGASIDAWSNVQSGPAISGTALMVASMNGHAEASKLLLSRGARLSVINDEGVEGSALEAARGRCPKTLRVLQQWEAASTSRCSYFLP